MKIMSVDVASLNCISAARGWYVFIQTIACTSYDDKINWTESKINKENKIL